MLHAKVTELEGTPVQTADHGVDGMSVLSLIVSVHCANDIDAERT